MPIIQPASTNPLVDGRQSPNAMMIRRGLERYFVKMSGVILAELGLASGRRADITVLMPKGDYTIVEIKSSIEDFKADQKWPEYREFCDYFYFATHPGVPRDIFPLDAGLIIADGYGAEIIREATAHKLSAPTRKALTLRFARTAASRHASITAFAIENGLDLPASIDAE